MCMQTLSMLLWLPYMPMLQYISCLIPQVVRSAHKKNTEPSISHRSPKYQTERLYNRLRFAEPTIASDTKARLRDASRSNSLSKSARIHFSNGIGYESQTSSDFFPIRKASLVISMCVNYAAKECVLLQESLGSAVELIILIRFHQLNISS